MRFRTLMLVVLFCLSPSLVLAQRVIKGKRIAPNGMVQLPYQAADSQGNVWMIYQAGWLQQSGNAPIYSQSAVITVNNNGVGHNANTARLDEKTGELLFENLQAPNVQITRRILVKAEENYVRYIDIFKNTTNQEQIVQVQYQSNLNYGIMSAENITDGKKLQAWVGMTQAGRAALDVFAGKGSKISPQLNWQANNSYMQAVISLPIPAGKEVALLHLHATVASVEAGQDFVKDIRSLKMSQSISPELRKLIVNFPMNQSYIGDREVLRGDVLDVVELRGGDQIKGNIKDLVFKLDTFYGKIELPAERLVGMFNTGQFKPRQLLVTSNGEIFGGWLDKPTIDLELSSGQKTAIPISQISRIGWRKRPGESEEMTLPDKPLVYLRSGDRIAVEMPDEDLSILTRYGMLKLKPQAIASVSLESEERGVHEVQLTDGSSFAGLVSSEKFEFKLAGGATGVQALVLPTPTISRIQFTTKIEEPEDDVASLELANEDLFVGTLVGQLKLDTAFDAITINAGEIKSLKRNKETATDVQIELWDQSKFSGQLQEPVLSAQLKSGVMVQVPVALVQQYLQPSPQSSAQMTDRIKEFVANLSAENWKDRERAESQLVEMGSIVVPALRGYLGKVPAEAEQRIESVIKQLSKKPTPAAQPNAGDE